MELYTIYTDGACSGNPGPGGWAAVIIGPESRKKEIKDGEELTTNQRMEMKAAVEALKSIREPARVKLYSDSAYLVNAFQQGWLTRWESNGWRTVKKKDVENRDLWEELACLDRYHRVEWHKVKGHHGDTYNERCDEMAREAIPRASQD